MFVGRLDSWRKAWKTAQDEGVVGNTVPHENTEDQQIYSVYRTRGEGAGVVYRVRWWRGSVPYIHCTCQAGLRNIRCKHAAYVLSQIYPRHFPRTPRELPEEAKAGAALLLGKKRS